MSSDVRLEFADFLERLADGRGVCSSIEWGKFIVGHYRDQEVEEIRRSVARLGISWAFREWPDLNLELLRKWSIQLRRSSVP
ncbi:MAG: hypothetical protein R3B84_16830 [Zavarzinella sp.]